MAEPHVALVTGANRGIGLEIVRQLSRRGLTTVLAARDLAKGKPRPLDSAPKASSTAGRRHRRD